jgi:2-oxoglutarate dehydrogenase E1 component
VSSIDDVARGEFSPVLSWSTAERDEDVRRVLACSGKVFYDLAEHVEGGEHRDLAVLRVEQLYPFPAEAVRAALARYPALTEVSWVQEEPSNMGAAQYVLPLLGAASPLDAPVRYVGRDARAATAEGYGSMHRRVQAALVTAAVDGGRSAVDPRWGGTR